MNENLDDKTIITIIICTILLVFILVFSFSRPKNKLEPSIQWKDNAPTEYIESIRS